MKTEDAIWKEKHEAMKQFLTTNGWKAHTCACTSPEGKKEHPQYYSPQILGSDFWFENCLKALNPDRELYYRTETYGHWLTHLVWEPMKIAQEDLVYALYEANEAAIWYMAYGIRITYPGDQEEEEHKGTIIVIDWEHPERNKFEYVEHWRGAQNDGFSWDFILCINGIPLCAILLRPNEANEAPCTQAIETANAQLSIDRCFPVYNYGIFVSDGESARWFDDQWCMKREPSIETEEEYAERIQAQWADERLTAKGYFALLKEHCLTYYNEPEPWKD